MWWFLVWSTEPDGLDCSPNSAKDFLRDGHTPTCGWLNHVTSSQLNVEAPTSNATAFENGRQLGLGGAGGLHEGLYEEALLSSPLHCHPPCVDSEGSPGQEGRRPPPGTKQASPLASDFPVFKTVREKYVYKRRENRYHQKLESGEQQGRKERLDTGWKYS